MIVDHVVPVAAGDRVVPTAARDPVRPLASVEVVVPGPAPDAVVARSAPDRVVPRPARGVVVPVAADDLVRAVAALQDVRAGAALHDVVALAAIDPVVARVALQAVVPALSEDHVVAAAAKGAVVSRPGVDQVVPRVRGPVAAVAIDLVVARASEQRVVAVVAEQPVVRPVVVQKRRHDRDVVHRRAHVVRAGEAAELQPVAAVALPADHRVAELLHRAVGRIDRRDQLAAEVDLQLVAVVHTVAGREGQDVGLALGHALHVLAHPRAARGAGEVQPVVAVGGRDATTAVVVHVDVVAVRAVPSGDRAVTDIPVGGVVQAARVLERAVDHQVGRLRLGHAVRPRARDDVVVPIAAERVRPVAAEHHVVAVAGPGHVLAGASVDRVLRGAGQDLVVPRACIDHVLIASGPRRAVARVDPVALRVAVIARVDHVVAVRPLDDAVRRQVLDDRGGLHDRQVVDRPRLLQPDLHPPDILDVEVLHALRVVPALEVEVSLGPTLVHVDADRLDQVALHVVEVDEGVLLEVEEGQLLHRRGAVEREDQRAAAGVVVRIARIPVLRHDEDLAQVARLQVVIPARRMRGVEDHRLVRAALRRDRHAGCGQLVVDDGPLLEGVEVKGVMLGGHRCVSAGPGRGSDRRCADPIG